jgi:uridylate kinase
MKKRRLVHVEIQDSLWSNGSINLQELESISKEVAGKVSQGFRVVIRVGGGQLESQYAKVFREYTKKRKDFELLRRKSAEINAMLVIMALRNLGVRTNIAPVGEGSILRDTWQATVMARSKG